jgi:hypothetical protein
MTTRDKSVVADNELLEMLRGEPELLAIADALTSTQLRRNAHKSVTAYLPRRRVRAASSIAAALAVVAFVSLLVATPWQSGPSLVERAAAAVGTGPVLHVVIAQDAPPDESLVDLPTGKQQARSREIEIWFDGTRDLKKTIETLDGEVLDELLETGTGSFTRGGQVYTCAWIAAHPVAAANAGVSCDSGGADASRPREREQPPSIDPALANFVDHYRSALASGAAREAGSGDVDGRDVTWLEFGAGRTRERVAVDAASFEPVFLEASGGRTTFRILSAETVSYSPAFFAKPEQVTGQSGGSVQSKKEVLAREAAGILGGAPLWLGTEWRGLELIAMAAEQRTIGSGTANRDVTVIRLTYGAHGADSGDARSTVEIYQATTCLVRVGWTCTPRDPSAPGTLGLPLGAEGGIGLVRAGDLYISIWNLDRQPEIATLDVARALTPAVVK